MTGEKRRNGWDTQRRHEGQSTERTPWEEVAKRTAVYMPRRETSGEISPISP